MAGVEQSRENNIPKLIIWLTVFNLFLTALGLLMVYFSIFSGSFSNRQWNPDSVALSAIIVLLTVLLIFIAIGTIMGYWAIADRAEKAAELEATKVAELEATKVAKSVATKVAKSVATKVAESEATKVAESMATKVAESVIPLEIQRFAINILYSEEYINYIIEQIRQKPEKPTATSILHKGAKEY